MTVIVTEGLTITQNLKTEATDHLRIVGIVAIINHGMSESIDGMLGSLTVSGTIFIVSQDTAFLTSTSQEQYFDLSDIVIGERLIIDSYKHGDSNYVAKCITRMTAYLVARPARLQTTALDIKEGWLMTTDNIKVIINDRTRISQTTVLSRLALGTQGDELLIYGSYDKDGLVTAKFITAVTGIGHRDTVTSNRH